LLEELSEPQQLARLLKLTIHENRAERTTGIPVAMFNER
jgi:hypothetical protein